MLLDKALHTRCIEIIISYIPTSQREIETTVSLIWLGYSDQTGVEKALYWKRTSVLVKISKLLCMSTMGQTITIPAALIEKIDQ